MPGSVGEIQQMAVPKKRIDSGWLAVINQVKEHVDGSLSGDTSELHWETMTFLQNPMAFFFPLNYYFGAQA
jgi:hypothetical protein